MPSEIVVQDNRSASLMKSAEPDASLLAVMERLAANPNMDPGKIEALFNVFINGQRKMREMVDEQEFAMRMADFKKKPPEIVKNRKVKMSGEAKGSGHAYSFEVPYADLDAYASAIMGGLAERGITWGFPFTQKDGQITVSCILRYGLYEHTPTTLTAAPDQSGAKNAIQAIASTVTYLERYTLCGATGFTAAMPDDDGNGGPRMPEAERQKHLNAIKIALAGEALNTAYQAALKAAKDAGDKQAETMFAEAKNARLRGPNRA
jgi:hypothetical protein